MKDVKQAADAVLGQLEVAIFGKREVLQRILAGLLAGGHLLIEDLPGTAKTLLAKALAKALGGEFRRLQGTPDLLPGDVTGSMIFNQKTSEFDFRPGPAFTHVLLADEINRATPRAQAALLECMAEGQISVENKTYLLPRPFVVIATQNPVEHEGTFALPEAQLDRFLLRLSLGYPSAEAEEKMLVRGQLGDPLEEVQRVVSLEGLVRLQQRVREVFVHPQVRRFVIQLVAATRTGRDFTLGAGPRATQGLYRASQALAAMRGRGFVLPDDVKKMAHEVLEHRLILGPEARLAQRDLKQVLEQIMGRVPAPIIEASELAGGGDLAHP